VGRTERLYKIQRLLESGRPISAVEFLQKLEVSRATFRRDLSYLRDRLGAPIEWDTEASGYVLKNAARADQKAHALPGLWLSEQEIHGLLTAIQLLTSLELQGLISTQIKPLRERLENLLAQESYSVEEIRHRIHLAPLGHRHAADSLFQVVSHGLLSRKRVFIRHFGRKEAEVTEREVSPQRLTYYRDNWYLDAFCHLRDDLRMFALDAIEDAKVLDKPAVSVDDAVLKQEFDRSYGIFAGRQVNTAVLKFSPFRARWVAKEIWHPDQKSSLLDDGSYVLEVPFSDDRELILDLLRQGKEVEVLAPIELREKLRIELKKTLSLYPDE
jgi:predicted DNA-binding transcriptional regulator YafY